MPDLNRIIKTTLPFSQVAGLEHRVLLKMSILRGYAFMSNTICRSTILLISVTFASEVFETPLLPPIKGVHCCSFY